MLSGPLLSVVLTECERLDVLICERGAFQQRRFDKVLQPLSSIGFLPLVM